MKLLDDKLSDFILSCKESDSTIRIGVNHGSLSNRILQAYGNTPKGMVESAMEYARVCKKLDFKNVVISLKSSDVNTMIESNLLLVKVMSNEGMSFPIHLGVTEAGNGIQGRVKSVYAIHYLLSQGIGDTFRISLTENPASEILLAKKLRDCPKMLDHSFESKGNNPIPFFYNNGKQLDRLDEYYIINKVKNRLSFELCTKNKSSKSKQDLALHTSSKNIEKNNPNSKFNVLALKQNGESKDAFILKCTIEAIPLIKLGLVRGLVVESNTSSSDFCDQLSKQILQTAAGIELQTTYISCPGCSRTLFNLEEVTRQIQIKTANLPPLKIGIMGCIINGPGEMREADYGYVGSGMGRVDLYKKDRKVKKNIPQAKAVDELLSLIDKNELNNGE